MHHGERQPLFNLILTEEQNKVILLSNVLRGGCVMRNNINRELNDIARDIQASQTKANEIYNAIGRAYYAKAKGNPDEEFRQMFADMDTIIKQQELMETRRKFLNGIVTCTNCKSDNNVELSFCANCGTRLPHKVTPVEEGQVRCTNCGNVMKAGQAFCGSCGAKAPQAAQPAAEVSQAPQPVVEAQPVGEVPQAVSQPTTPIAEVSQVAQTPVQPVTETQPIVEPQQEPQQVEAPVTLEESKPVVSPAKEETVAQPIQQEVKLSCPNCGTVVNNPEAVFCPNCGNRLNR